jgi:hypothetical protein
LGIEGFKGVGIMEVWYIMPEGFGILASRIMVPPNEKIPLPFL